MIYLNLEPLLSAGKLWLSLSVDLENRMMNSHLLRRAVYIQMGATILVQLDEWVEKGRTVSIKKKLLDRVKENLW
jgi:hypothetical protein